MEFPDPDSYDDWREWARQMLTQLRQIEEIDAVEGPAHANWINVSGPGGPGYAGSWVDVHWLWPVRFIKILGTIYFEGQCSWPLSGVNSLIFTLPEEYRPGIWLQTYNLYNATVRVDSSTGNVTYITGSPLNVDLSALVLRRSRPNV